MIPCCWNWILGLESQRVHLCHCHQHPHSHLLLLLPQQDIVFMFSPSMTPINKWILSCNWTWWDGIKCVCVSAAGERRPEETFLSLCLGEDQTEPLDMSVWTKNKIDDADTPAATTLTKNDDACLLDRVHAHAAVLLKKATATETHRETLVVFHSTTFQSTNWFDSCIPTANWWRTSAITWGKTWKSAPASSSMSTTF